jgi:methylmalonyl-CoA/ethylmalonyl-CoA epimerase
MGKSGVAIRRIGQIAVVVRDVERAKLFYRDVLELEHLFDAPPGLSFFHCNGVRLMLSAAETGEHARASSILYLDVADIAHSHALLEERGARIEQPPHRVANLGDRELWLSFFRDSEDNFLSLMSEVPKT